MSSYASVPYTGTDACFSEYCVQLHITTLSYGKIHLFFTMKHVLV
jgi:hypothetical protein